ncbi:MAG: FlgO family outer membrane protein [Betaproteobacteria bacterium]|nr:FlgO family outer membrane protein [Betaproteobacteria bacterium]
MTLPLVAAAAAVLMLGGCNTQSTSRAEPTYEDASVSRNTFMATNYNAVDELMQRFRAVLATSNHGIGTGGPFIVATLVNIDKLDQSSTLGRVISEQVNSRLVQLGYGAVELKISNSVFMKRNEGEFMLTREIQDIASAHNAQAVIVGTYAESADFVYVSLKVVNPANSNILAAHDYALPIDRQIRRMTSGGARRF